MVSCACLISLHRTLYKGARAPPFAAVVSIHSGKCYCSPEDAVATPVIAASNGRHPPVLCGCCAARQRCTALCWRRDGAPPGERQSRESLTQDSRSAVKARLFDPLRESFGEERCAPRGDGVMAFKRPSRGFRAFVMRRNPLESRADGGMRAYVISGGPLMTTRKPAPCVRATACWRRSLGVARMKAGDACVVLQARRLLRWQRS